MLDKPEYECFELPSQKKRVFLKTDYMPLYNYYKEKYGFTELR